MWACLSGSLLTEIKKEESHPGVHPSGAIPPVPPAVPKASVERQSILSAVLYVHEAVVCAGRCAAACIGVAAFRAFPAGDIAPFVHGDLGDQAFRAVLAGELYDVEVARDEEQAALFGTGINDSFCGFSEQDALVEVGVLLLPVALVDRHVELDIFRFGL